MLINLVDNYLLGVLRSICDTKRKMVNLPDIKPENESSVGDYDADGDEILPADTLAILTEFLREKALIESHEIDETGSDRTFGENWVG